MIHPYLPALGIWLSFICFLIAGVAVFKAASPDDIRNVLLSAIYLVLFAIFYLILNAIRR